MLNNSEKPILRPETSHPHEDDRYEYGENEEEVEEPEPEDKFEEFEEDDGDCCSV